MKTSRIIIGLVGEPSGGKDTAADYLVKKYKFTHVSTGDLVREYITSNKLGDLTRQNLKAAAIKLREQFGSDYLADTALQSTKSDRIVVSGLRTVAEVHCIQLNKGIILCVNANIKTRFERAKQRGRIGEDIDYETFKKIQASEQRSQDPNRQNVEAVISIADENIQNNGSLQELYSQIDDFMNRLIKREHLA
ncbi:MAG: hypothetical protein QG675_521 [Patescibacteria group bacterium]|jgi:dephospho-CoA kinase|nr:hypothetical protein [Patescibacteria group bacterium]